MKKKLQLGAWRSDTSRVAQRACKTFSPSLTPLSGRSLSLSLARARVCGAFFLLCARRRHSSRLWQVAPAAEDRTRDSDTIFPLTRQHKMSPRSLFFDVLPLTLAASYVLLCPFNKVG